MMAFSFAECRRGVGASILQLLWLTLKGYNHCKQTKVEDIREFSPGSSPLCMYVHAKSLSRAILYLLCLCCYFQPYTQDQDTAFVNLASGHRTYPV